MSKHEGTHIFHEEEALSSLPFSKDAHSCFFYLIFFDIFRLTKKQESEIQTQVPLYGGDHVMPLSHKPFGFISFHLLTSIYKNILIEHKKYFKNKHDLQKVN